MTLVVPFPAGGATDVIARLLAEPMKASLGQPLLIENISGASSSLGVAHVARANPDGYTICIGLWSTHVANPAVLKLPYDPLRDFEPIALLTDNPMWVVAGNHVPAIDLKELISWMKANPGKATVGMVGAGGATEIVGSYFRKLTETSFQFVPYKGTPQLLPDLIAGRIDLTFTQLATSLDQVRSGQVRALGVMAKERWWAAPNVPTVDESGAPGLYASFWHALWAPKGTPKDVISRLNAAVRSALADESVRQRLTDSGQAIFARDLQTPEYLATFHRAEIDKWWPIIKSAGIKAE
jgi:tripartite-type tricarboxylate transporter receptor subunit TctC